MIFPFNHKNDDSHEFQPMLAELEDAPTGPLSRWIFWIVILTVLFFVGWAILGEIDIVVSARGQVVPDGQVKILQPLDAGLISNIFVHEGQFVKKGQLLVEIDPSSTKPELASSQKTLEHDKLESERLEATLEDRPFNPSSLSDSHAVRTQASLYQSSMAALQTQLKEKEQSLKRVDDDILSNQSQQTQYSELLKIAKEKESRLKQVLDLIAKEDYEKVLQDIVTDENTLKDLSFKREALTHQQGELNQQIATIQSTFRTDNLKDLANKEKDTTELTSKIQQISFRNIKQRLLAPVDGYVDTLYIHTNGGVVTPAQKVLSIVPIAVPLVVRANVLNKDIGFVHVGLPVLIKVDTFDFQKYGTLKGKVKLILQNSRPDNKQENLYPIDIELLTDSLKVDGKRQSVTPGMSVTAEVKVGKRRIIEFFIYPLIKYLNEGMSVR